MAAGAVAGVLACCCLWALTAGKLAGGGVSAAVGALAVAVTVLIEGGGALVGAGVAMAPDVASACDAASAHDVAPPEVGGALVASGALATGGVLSEGCSSAVVPGKLLGVSLVAVMLAPDSSVAATAEACEFTIAAAIAKAFRPTQVGFPSLLSWSFSIVSALLAELASSSL